MEERSERTQNPLNKLSVREALDDPGLLRTLIDALPDCIYVKDSEGRYVSSNAAHVKKLGAASLEEVARKADFELEELAERYHAPPGKRTQSGA